MRITTKVFDHDVAVILGAVDSSANSDESGSSGFSKWVVPLLEQLDRKLRSRPPGRQVLKGYVLSEVFIANRGHHTVIYRQAQQEVIGLVSTGLNFELVVWKPPILTISLQQSWEPPKMPMDTSAARPLKENANLCFRGVDVEGPFAVSAELARDWLDLSNPEDLNNKSVLKRYISADDLAGHKSDRFVIDFDNRDIVQASKFLVPFSYVAQHVKPTRDLHSDERLRTQWWLYRENRWQMRRAVSKCRRYIATPIFSRHFFLSWIDKRSLADADVIVIAKDDDYTFGVLSSAIHKTWVMHGGHALGEGLSYANVDCFETFPFPRSTPLQKQQVATLAQSLDTLRKQWLTDAQVTLTDIYDQVEAQKPRSSNSSLSYALLKAHTRLDAAVARLYDWNWPLPDEEILRRLLVLNLERSG